MRLLEDRVAVVTGAGRGIGLAIVETFAREGARVVLNDVDAAPAQAAQAKVKALGGEVSVCLGDVSKSKDTDALMRHAATTYGRVDILVNNAGICRDRVIHKMTDEDWDFVLAVNLKGTFNCIRSTVPFMRDLAKAELDRDGEVRYHRKIVNFFSTAAIRGNPGQANYTAAKMGNVGLTRTVAQEWARFRINVNAVAPGFTDTRLTKPTEESEDGLGIPAQHREAMIERIPFGRIGTPQDIANAVLFFASPLSDFVTGQELNVSGGLQIP